MIGRDMDINELTQDIKARKKPDRIVQGNRIKHQGQS